MGLEIALAAGLTGAAATVAGAAINLSASLALSYGAQKLRGKSATGSSGETGAQLSLEVGANVPRQALIGETLVAGSLAYWHLTGANNDVLCQVIALVDHECDGLTGVVIDGKYRNIDGGGFVETFGDKLRIKFHNGAAGQVADEEVVANSSGYWSANERGTGVCYAVVFATYDTAFFPSGSIPEIKFLVRGAKLFDVRTSTRIYTDNWGVGVYNVLRGIPQVVGGPLVVGANASADSVRADDAIAACNVSDEMVSRAIGGPEKRYRVGAVLRSDQTTLEHLELLLAAGAGEAVESAGIYRILAGVARAPVATVTDGDLIVDKSFTFSPRRSRSALVNTIEATWFDPASPGTTSALPARSAAVDRTSDGGIRLARTLDLTACPSGSQGQRVMEIERRRARRQGSAACTVRAALCTLEPGDWIAFNSNRQGWVGRTFEIVAAPQDADLTAELSLVEVDDTIDDWTAGDEIASNAATDLPSGAPSFSVVTGLALVGFTSTTLTGQSRPGLRLTWTPVTDFTVNNLRVQYRPVGAADAMELTVLDPTSGTFAWLNGVLGGVTYEAKVLPVTVPARTTDWSAWVATAAPVTAQVVDTAAVANSVPPNTITGAMLSAQERFERSLATASSTVQGSLSAMIADTLAEARRVAESLALTQLQVAGAQTGIREERTVRTSTDEALAQRITEITASLNGLRASVYTEETARISGDNASAIALQAVQTTVNDHTSAITQVQQSFDGIGASWVLSLSVDGFVNGYIALDGSLGGSTIGFLANSFYIAQPGSAGGAAVQVFNLGVVNGLPALVLNADMYADGSFQARHISTTTLSALSADLGTVEAGYLGSADGGSYWNLNTGDWQIGG